MIFSGGTIDAQFTSDFFPRLQPALVIAADRGLTFCSKNRIQPDYIVGDFDSAETGVVDRYREAGTVPIDQYRPEKDMTDTDIAIEKAIALGADELWLFGATGTRLDHTLSNIFDLIKCREHGIHAYVADRNNLITMPVSHEYTVRREDRFGDYFSLFAFRGPVTGLTLEGFRYPLSGCTLNQGDGGLCVSNELAADTGRVTWEDGILIVMQTRD